MSAAAKPQLEEEDFLDSAVVKSLICCICTNVVRVPRVTCNEQHFNCLDCLKRLVVARNSGAEQRKCPQCRMPVLHCERDNKPGLPAPFIQQLVESQRCHCPQKCGTVMKAYEITEHIQIDCPNSKTTCPFWDVGCKDVFQRCELADHLSQQQCSHLQMTLKKCVAFNTTVSLQQTKIHKLCAIVDAQTVALNEMRKDMNGKLDTIAKALPPPKRARTRAPAAAPAAAPPPAAAAACPLIAAQVAAPVQAESQGRRVVLDETDSDSDFGL